MNGLWLTEPAGVLPPPASCTSRWIQSSPAIRPPSGRGKMTGNATPGMAAPNPVSDRSSAAHESEKRCCEPGFDDADGNALDHLGFGPDLADVTADIGGFKIVQEFAVISGEEATGQSWPDGVIRRERVGRWRRQ